MSGKMSVEKIRRKLQEDREYFIQNKYVVATDDWCPCYPGNKILVTIMFFQLNPRSTPTVKMSAWGADDTGYEIEFQCGNRDIAYEVCFSIYKQWKQNVFDKITDGVDMQWFADHCFYPA